jgi:hypothetical protein
VGDNDVLSPESYKHHYIPQCYLKRWAGDDRRLTVYERPHRDLSIRRLFPAETGWERNLYSSTVERAVMSRVDQSAAHALDRLLDVGEVPSLDEAQLRGWTHFVISLLHRHPRRVAEYGVLVEETFHRSLAKLDDQAQLEYLRLRQPEDPPTAAEWFKLHEPRLLAESADFVMETLTFSERFTRMLEGTTHSVIPLERSKFDLLTSDRPIIYSAGSEDGRGPYVVLPIGPRHLYMATSDERTRSDLLGHVEDGSIAKRINESVLTYARRWAYARDDSQTRFIENRFGGMARSASVAPEPT